MTSIVIMLPDLRGGGAERVNLDLAHEFRRLGHEVEFVVRLKRGELLNEALVNFPVIALDADRVRHVPRALFSYLRHNRPDGLIASMWPLTNVAPAVCAVASPKTRCLVCEHGILSLQYQARGATHRTTMQLSMAVGYRLAQGRVGVSQGVADDMAKLSGLPRGKFAVINNPIPWPTEPENVALAEAEALWTVPPGARILTVSRLKKVKNHALLLRAFQRLGRSDARLMIVGSGELETELRALAKELEIAERVIFAGHKEDPTPFYRTADLFVLSSDREGFGNVLVEAMANGTPIVSTDCPSGPSEILEGGKYGALVPTGDHNALSRAIDDALTRPADPKSLQERARDFLPEKAAAAYLELLFPR